MRLPLRACVRVIAFYLRVPVCRLGDTGQHAPVDHATPLRIPDVQQEMRTWYAFNLVLLTVCAEYVFQLHEVLSENTL